MYAPAPHDEITGLTRYIDQQLAALRASVHGLSDEQATATPCRSSLSLAALLKHTAPSMRGYVRQLAGSPSALDEQAYAEYLANLEIGDDEKVSDVLAEFDSARDSMLGALISVDPNADVMAPPAPWHGILEAQPVKARYDVVHILEEVARHAGHADIIREQLDGMAVPALAMTIEGTPASNFFQPYDAAPGTIGAS